MSQVTKDTEIAQIATPRAWQGVAWPSSGDGDVRFGN